jgi:hypothetical protein
VTDHRIILKRVGDRFAVRVEPPLESESFDTDRDTYKQARGFAGGLRLSRGWPIDDHAADEWEARS